MAPSLPPELASKVRRTRALMLTGAVHAGLLALLFAPGATAVQPQLSVLALSDLTSPMPSVEPAPPRAPQPKPVPPTPIQPIVVPPPPVPLPTPNEMVVALLEQAETANAGGACDLTAPVQAALQSSEAVQTSLPKLPRDQRSVANALMIWNVAWVVPDARIDGRLDTSAADAIRETIAGTIAAASPNCRMQPQAGARLIILPGTPENIVLALGSEVWRWQDLLETARPDWDAAGPQPTVREPRFASVAGASLSLR